MYITNAFGLITGQATATRLPNVPCLRARIKPSPNNVGGIRLGASDSTVVFDLTPGTDTDFFEITNLNELWMQAPSGTSDVISYWIQR